MYIFKRYFLSIIFLLLILLFAKDIFYINTRFEYYGGYNDHGLSEWLINYQGGFVRRGLPGEILFQISNIFFIPANYLWQIITIVSYLYLVFWLIRRSKNKFYLELIISPILIGMPIFTGFVWKKDVFLILLFLLCLSIFKKKINLFIKIFLINIICIFATLSHESFFFYAIPPLFFISFTFWKKTETFVKKIFRSFISFLSVFFVFIILFIENINTNAEELIAKAYKIHHSWSNLWLVTEGKVPDDLGGAIFTFSYASIKDERSDISYFTIFWFFLFLFSFYYIIQLNYKFKYKEKIFLFKILMTQFIFLTPLFYFAGDWSRWFFYLTISSLVVYLTNINYFQFKLIFFENLLSKFLNLKIFFIRPPIWPMFFIGFPYVNYFMRSLEMYLWVTPFGKLFAGFYKFILFFQRIFNL